MYNNACEKRIKSTDDCHVKSKSSQLQSNQDCFSDAHIQNNKQLLQIRIVGSECKNINRIKNKNIVRMSFKLFVSALIVLAAIYTTGVNSNSCSGGRAIKQTEFNEHYAKTISQWLKLGPGQELEFLCGKRDGNSVYVEIYITRNGGAVKFCTVAWDSKSSSDAYSTSHASGKSISCSSVSNR